jgi:MoaA/NifB/PqqE/SkfB family radical SAM enzyme
MYKHNRTAKQKAYESSVQSAIAGNIHPVHAYMMITNECDMSCGYCIAQHKLNDDMGGLEEWKQAADIAYMLGNRDICFGGGEPLLKPYLLDLVDYVSARDTIVSIVTNGHCLNEELLHALDEAGLNRLRFSIDTLGNDGQPQFGKDLTPELERTLQYIAESKFRFYTSVATIVTKYNLPILPEMLRRFSALGMTTDFMLMVRGVGNHSRTEELAFGEEDIDEVERVFEKLLSMKSRVAVCHDFSNRLRVKMGVCTPAQVYQMHMEDPSGHNCKGGVNDLHVDNDGRISICETGFASSTHIFDLNSIEDYHALIKRNRTVTDQCKSCPWTYRWILTHLEETGGFMRVMKL